MSREFSSGGPPGRWRRTGPPAKVGLGAGGVLALVIAVAALAGSGSAPAPTPSAAGIALQAEEVTPTPSPSPTPSPTPGPTPSPTPAPARSSGGTLLPVVPAGAIAAVVTRVVDGDTVVLDGIGVGERDAAGGRKSRLIGIDTPEVYGGTECYGAEASAFTKQALDGTRVLVDFDVERTDRYGRALVYVWQPDGAFFNARLAAEGYAQQMTIAPNVRYAELFTALVGEARQANRGLWAGCAATPTPTRAPAPAAPAGGNCHASYPDFCIPPPPPDLDCGDMERKNFRVRWDVPGPDPHGFDGDEDGLGCER